LKGRFLAVLFGVVLPSLAAFGVLHHDMVKRALLHEVDQSLARRAASVAEQLSRSGIAGASDLGRFRLASEPLLRSSTPEVYVELADSQGHSVWTSESRRGWRKPAELVPVFAQPGYGTAVLADGLKLRKLSRPLALPDGTPVLAVVAQSLSHLDTALQASIGQSLLLGMAVVAVTGGLGVWALRSAFAPLDTLVETAERIVSTDDVTQRVKLDSDQEDHIRRTGEAFNALMDRVQHLLEIARQLLADTSHELRNPLTVLMTDLDLLRQDLSSEEREEVVSEAQATVQRMTRLVRDLLLLSAAEAQSERIELVASDLHELVARVANRLGKALLKEGQQLLVRPLQAPVPLALLQPERTEQILTNLIENAIFYSSDGVIELSVSALEHGRRVAVSVTDRGCGIPAQELPRLFDRFFRIDPSRARSSGGSGLGLPVARALARAQRGDVTVQSRLGEGSCFRLVCLAADGAEAHSLPYSPSLGSRKE
jgi:signal transduction histidine kinase